MYYVNFEYAYLVLTIPSFAFWLLLYIFSKNTRKEQLFMSLVILPLGSISELIYFKDYWVPTSISPIFIGALPLFIEDFIFSFSIGGIGAVIYESFFKKRLIKKRVHHHLSMAIIVVIFATISFLLLAAGVNSIYATSIGFIAVAFLMLSQRRDLFFNALFSGFAVMATMFVSYYILFNITSNIGELYKEIWLLHETNLDVRLFNIPITEMVWGFTWGMVAGPIYEYWKDLRMS